MTESNETPPSGETSDLQFDHAEPDSASVDAAATVGDDTPGTTTVVECASCGTELTQAYYAIGEAAMCGSCKEELVSVVESRTQPIRLVRALGYGVPAAMLGSAIYYAILAITDYEIGLVSILIGFMVGAAIRAASGPGGGRRYQLLAAGLTYVAIVTTYVPFVIEGLQEVADDEMEVAVADVAGTESPDATTLPPQEVEPSPPSAVEMVLAVVLILGIAFVAPFLAGFENIMGILIIGFGVYQAWKMNKRLDLEITGPHSVGPQPAQST
ncbi:MAG: hypothetical protein KUG77_25930 [Nannocystaceae bacterium]|nr:hypothetical protein [Nannocystaceae bacterium]